MLQIHLAPPSRAAPPVRCCIAGCADAASRTPVLRIALTGTAHVSRVPLPAHVCEAHATRFGERFLTAARRAAIEDALRRRGRPSPDWARTAIVLE